MTYVDGAYCGNPSKAKTGTGALFISSHEPGVDAVSELAPNDWQRLEKGARILSEIGQITYCGGIGT